MSIGTRRHSQREIVRLAFFGSGAASSSIAHSVDHFCVSCIADDALTHINTLENVLLFWLRMRIWVCRLDFVVACDCRYDTVNFAELRSFGHGWICAGWIAKPEHNPKMPELVWQFDNRIGFDIYQYSSVDKSPSNWQKASVSTATSVWFFGWSCSSYVRKNMNDTVTSMVAINLCLNVCFIGFRITCICDSVLSTYCVVDQFIPKSCRNWKMGFFIFTIDCIALFSIIRYR